MEYFAFAAITNKSHQFSHSVLGGLFVTPQYLGQPSNADAPSAAVFSLESDGYARSTMITLTSSKSRIVLNCWSLEKEECCDNC